MGFLRTSLSLRFVGFILLPLLFFVAFEFQKLSSLSHNKNEQLALKGLRSIVEVYQDEYGIPFISAAHKEDAFTAVGYLHARDRLWQMEVFRRIAAGRLSEVLGRNSIDRDAWFRTIGLHRSAKQSWQQLDEKSQASLQAYVNGVNQWIENTNNLPPEFQLLDFAPEPWTVYDSLSVMKLFAHNLGGNLRDELAYLAARKTLTPEQLVTLFPQLTESNTDILAELEHINIPEQGIRLLDEIQADLKLGGQFVGSNAWVVSGQHTSSGNALLANDPHLGIQIPSLWYTLKVDAADWQAAGQSIPGLPVVVFGRNKHIMWGGTNLMADQQDLHFERVNPNNLSQYWAANQWQDFKIEKEKIYVKTDFPEALNSPIKPIEITIKSTRNGPVVNELLALPDAVMSLNWVSLQSEKSYQGFYALNFASDWQEFRQALSVVSSPALNILYADINGNIGHQTIGKVPLREGGQGLVPQAGWLHTDIQYIPFPQMPHEFNPQRGYIANANNQVVSDDYPYYLSSDWANNSRVERIRAMLKERIAAGDPIDVEYFSRIQNDNVDLHSLSILPHLLKLTPQNERQKEALSILSKWDGRYELSSEGAAIYHAWYQNLLQRIFADELKLSWEAQSQNAFTDGVYGGLAGTSVIALLEHDTANWCDDKSTPQQESCEQIMWLALDDGLEELSKLAGGDMQSWRWGELHTAVFNHVPFSQINLMDSLFERKVASPGTYNTVNATTAEFKENEGYVQSTGPGFRQIIDSSNDMSGHYFINSTGQSGHLLSDHYDDMLVPFRDGKLLNLSPSISSYTGPHLKLLPQGD